MKRFIEGENRFQSSLFPESLEDYIAEDNSIRVVDAFVDCSASGIKAPLGGWFEGCSADRSRKLSRLE